MVLRNRWISLAASLALCIVGACKQKPASAERKESRPQNSEDRIKPLSEETVARLHWLGKRRLAEDTNAANLVTLWNLPESQKVEARALAKLALFPWLSSVTNQEPISDYDAVVTNYPLASLFQPLLQDLVNEEWQAEVRNATNGSGELALAILLGEEQSAYWQTNLPKICDSLKSSFKILASNPAIQHHAKWTIVTFSADSSFLSHFLETLTNKPVANEVESNPPWLEAQIRPKELSAVLGLGWKLPPRTPQITGSISGDGNNVLTRADLDFPSPLLLELESWNIPTNLIHDPLIGFSAVRGLRPLLRSLKQWNDLQLGTPPNQVFFWAQKGAPFLHYFAAPSIEASNQVRTLNNLAVERLNPMIEPTRLGKFQTFTNSQRLFWKGIPWFSPRLDVVESDGTPLVFGGFSGSWTTNQPIPAELMAQLSGTTNLIWYDWEITAPCVSGLTQLGQMTRAVLGRAQLPGRPTVAWLFAIGPKLGNSASALTLTSPTRLAFHRSSTIGLTGAELQLLADWLESPRFPAGLHMLLTTPPPPKLRPLPTGPDPAATNSTSPGTPPSQTNQNPSPQP